MTAQCVWLQYNKDKVDSAIKSTEQLNNKMSQLNKKKKKLFTVILFLNKLMTAARSSGSNIVLTNLLVNDGNEKEFFDLLNAMIEEQRLTEEEEATPENPMGGNRNLSNLLATMLSTFGDQAMPGDGRQN